MKYFKIVFGLLILLPLVFLAIGFVKPSVSYESRVTINSSVDESWKVMTDPSLLSEWLVGYKRTELISGEAGTVGAISNIYFDQNGKEVVIKETITNVVPQKMIGMNFENDFMDMVYQIEIQDVDGKTQIDSKTTAKGNGLISRSMTALMKGALVQQEDTNLHKLKDLVGSR